MFLFVFPFKYSLFFQFYSSPLTFVKMSNVSVCSYKEIAECFFLSRFGLPIFQCSETKLIRFGGETCSGSSRANNVNVVPVHQAGQFKRAYFHWPVPPTKGNSQSSKVPPIPQEAPLQVQVPRGHPHVIRIQLNLTKQF